MKQEIPVPEHLVTEEMLKQMTNTVMDMAAKAANGSTSLAPALFVHYRERQEDGEISQARARYRSRIRSVGISSAQEWPAHGAIRRSSTE